MAAPNTGENNPAAGGEQGVLDPAEILFQEDETGAIDPAAGGTTGEEQEGEGQPKEEIAFSKRLAAAREKDKGELREQLKREILEEFKNQPPVHHAGQPVVEQQPASYQPPPPLTNEQAEQVAEKFNTSVEMVYYLYQKDIEMNQLKAINQNQAQLLNNLTGRLSENTDKEKAKLEAEALRVQNPAVPQWSDREIEAFRAEHNRKYGALPPWNQTYSLYIADQAIKGNLTRQAQQETLRNIAGRERQTVKISGTEQSQKPSVTDLSKDEFEKLKERAIQGEFKRS